MWIMVRLEATQLVLFVSYALIYLQLLDGEVMVTGIVAYNYHYIPTLLPVRRCWMSKRSEQPRKIEALKACRALNSRSDRVTDEWFLAEEFFDATDLVQVKYEMVRRVSQEGATVTEAARRFGFTRPTFYQAQKALQEEGLPGLVPKQPGPKGAHKLTQEVLAYAKGERDCLPAPTWEELAARIRERFGVRVHPRSVERALMQRGKEPEEVR